MLLAPRPFTFLWCLKQNFVRFHLQWNRHWAMGMQKKYGNWCDGERKMRAAKKLLLLSPLDFFC